MPTISEHLMTLLRNLPKTPGVYQMKDKKGVVIYVGKAINLFSRVNSYFRETGTLTLAKKNMVKQIVDIETILCQTEVEALVLETNLIKHLAPKYNILMKDDKNLAYIKFTNDPIAEVYKTRIRTHDGGQYFGPYTQGTNITSSLKLLKRIFRVRACRMQFRKEGDRITITDRAGRTPPCMDYYIGICPGPCLLDPNKIQEHTDNMDRMQAFLRWKSHEIIADLRNKMLAYAQEQKFEEAGKLKADIEAIETLGQKQLARDLIAGDHDVFVCMEKYGQYFVGLTQIRSGRMVGVFRHTIEDRGETRETMIAQFLARQYISEDDHDMPESIILEAFPEDGALQDFFIREKIELTIPQIGPKKELLDFTRNQVREYAYKTELATLETKVLTREYMVNVLTRLGYPVPKKWPIRFECYDISHTHGQFTYASRVVIENGKPLPSAYKKYKIRTLEDGEIDDFASHREVMYRRTLESIRSAEWWGGDASSARHPEAFPALIIIDGGKGQLSSAIRGIREAMFDRGISWEELPPICSIAKREEEVFLPNNTDSILFEKGTPELMVLQKARDESHRFSITANRSARTRAMKKNILEELPGIGPTTRKKLLKSAGTLDGIRLLREEDIMKIVNKKQLTTLRDHGLY